MGVLGGWPGCLTRPSVGADRMKARGGSKKAIVAVQHAILVAIIWHMFTTGSTHEFPESHQPSRHCPVIYSPAPDVMSTAGRIGLTIRTLRERATVSRGCSSSARRQPVHPFIKNRALLARHRGRHVPWHRERTRAARRRASRTRQPRAGGGCAERVMILLRHRLAIWSCRPPGSTNLQSTSPERLQASWQALESVLHPSRRHRGRATRVRQGSWPSPP